MHFAQNSIQSIVHESLQTLRRTGSISSLEGIVKEQFTIHMNKNSNIQTGDLELRKITQSDSSIFYKVILHVS